MKKFSFFSALLLLFSLGCNPTTKKVDHAQPSNSEIPTALLETYWKVVEINGQPVNNPPTNQKEAHIILTKEGNRLQGSAGCNSLMGSYQLMDGNRIKFSGLASTKMACPDMAIENVLGKAIEMSDNYAINDKFLILHKAKMAPLVKFEAKE